MNFPFPAGFALLQQIPDTTLQRFREGIPPKPPPIPGPMEAVLRVIFNAPAWAWVIGMLLILVAAAFLIRLLWRHRKAIPPWFTTRSRPLRTVLAGCVLLVLVLAGWGGTVSWSYMQHDNAFCLGCHIMEGPWNKFALDAGKHSELGCHDCHQQSMYANARQLFLWIAERPEKIPPHAKVPTERCEACHASNESEKWTRIKQTAGHRVHLESDSTALDNVQCVTCHGDEVHEFIPADKTCGKSGCHEQLEIKLGKMSFQTTLHCVQCHQFTAEVPLLATRDSAAGTLRPASQQCLNCHEMQRIVRFDPARDPHQGVCGTCHNPHTQETPQAAGATCTTAQCHATWRQIPFHQGTAHRRVGERCLVCHDPHAARIDASDCVACHNRVLVRFGSLRPPLPFDTTRALRPVPRRNPPPEDSPGEKEVVPSRDHPPSLGLAAEPAGREGPLPRCVTCHEPGIAALPRAVADTFSHARHRNLACLTCHATGRAHGELTFQPPRGCQICHHQASQRANCATCHSPDERVNPIALTIAISVRDSAPRPRPVRFSHPTHREVECVQCHTEPVTLDPAPAVRTCRECHENHHTANRSCATCHSGEELRAAHARDVSASHRACASCHPASTVAMLTPDRSFCVTCHAKQADHYAEGQCSSCHFLKSPDELRATLMGPPAR